LSSLRGCKGLIPDIEYPFRDRAALVTNCGRIGYKRREINLSTVFAGQLVGVTQVTKSIWLVSFKQYDLGYLDISSSSQRAQK